MKTVELSFAQPQAFVPSVVAGERGATRLRVDCAQALEAWPQARFVIALRRADGEAWPACERGADADGMIEYVLAGADTAVAGMLDIEVQARCGDAVAKTFTAQLRVEPSVLPEQADAPTPDWVDQTLDARDAAVAAQAAAEAAARDATDTAGSALGELIAAAKADVQDAADAAEAACDAARVAMQDTADAAQLEIAGALDTAQQTLSAYAAGAREAEAGAQAARDDALAAAAGADAQARRACASRWAFHARGRTLAIRPAEGSVIDVTATEDCTVTHDGQTHPARAGEPLSLIAGAGENVLTASAGTLAAAYNRDSMDLLGDLAAGSAATGNPARLGGLIGGLPLSVTASFAATQAGTPTPEAPAPIMGTEAVSITRSGVNLFDPLAPASTSYYARWDRSETGGRITLTAATTPIYISVATRAPVMAGVTLTFHASWFRSGAASAAVLAFWLTSDLKPISQIGASLTVSGESKTIVTTAPPVNAASIGLVFYGAIGSPAPAVNDYVEFTNVQLEIGDATTSWEPHRSDTFAVALPSPLYGLPGATDEADVTGGQVTRRTAYIPLKGTEAWDAYSTSDWTDTYIKVSGVGLAQPTKTPPQGALCTHLAAGAVTSTSYIPNRFMVHMNGNVYMGLEIPGVTSVADWKAYLAAQHAAGAPVTIVCPLAAPVTEAIDAVTIPALSGENVLTASAGAALAVLGRLSAQGMMDRLQGQITAIQNVVTGG